MRTKRMLYKIDWLLWKGHKQVDFHQDLMIDGKRKGIFQIKGHLILLNLQIWWTTKPFLIAGLAMIFMKNILVPYIVGLLKGIWLGQVNKLIWWAKVTLFPWKVGLKPLKGAKLLVMCPLFEC